MEQRLRRAHAWLQAALHDPPKKTGLPLSARCRHDIAMALDQVTRSLDSEKRRRS